MAGYLPDTNIWLALAIDGHPHHGAAVEWLDTISDHDRVLFSRATQQSLLRLLSTAAVFIPFGTGPLTNVEAWAVFDAFCGDRRVSMCNVEPAGVDGFWRTFSSVARPSPKRWMDAYLAAIAVAEGSTLVTIDRAYLTEFPGLNVALLSAD